MSLLLKGQPVAEKIQADIMQHIRALPRPPQLAIIQVGNDPASSSYIKRKLKMADILGVPIVHTQLDQRTDNRQLLQQINRYNQNQDIQGIIVQLPLPPHIDEATVLQAINPQKDVDGLTLINLGKLMANQPQLVPATARGIIALLDYYQIPITGQNITVIGRSRLVGQPIAQLLLHQGATVTIAHRQTKGLAELSRRADVLIVAAGHPGLITSEFVADNSVVIDVGLTRTDQGLAGDVAIEVQSKVKAITPVPGGVGPLTVTCLFQNLVQATGLQ